MSAEWWRAVSPSEVNFIELFTNTGASFTPADDEKRRTHASGARHTICLCQRIPAKKETVR